MKFSNNFVEKKNKFNNLSKSEIIALMDKITCKVILRQTINNFAFTLTNNKNEVVCSYSGGKTPAGIKKRTLRKTHQAALEAMDLIISRILQHKFTRVIIIIKSYTNFVIKSSVNTLFKIRRLKVVNILDRKPIPHNGMRKPKKRRI